MSKAEERALEVYPKDIEEYVDINGMKSVVDNNSWQRTIFLKGYHQAERDNELTWEDIREIYCTTLNLREHLGASVFGEPLYQEVLKRFKALKEE